MCELENLDAADQQQALAQSPEAPLKNTALEHMPSRKHASSALMSMKSLQNDKHTGALRSRGCEDQVQRAGAKEQARGMEIYSNKRCAFKHIASASPLGCSKIEIAGSDLVLISEGIDLGLKETSRHVRASSQKSSKTVASQRVRG